MNLAKTIIFGAVLCMIGGTALCLSDVSHHQRMGAPGVKVGPHPLHDDKGQIAARQSVILPDEVLGAKASEVPLTTPELGLPVDTTFGQVVYRQPNKSVQLTVVLMGTDRTSIHQPQYCLAGQDWHIDRTEHVMIPIDRPFHYELPALKLSISRQVKIGGQFAIIHGFYVYWFVSGDHITADMGARMISLGWTALTKGELERWAYVSYLTACLPGQEDVTYQGLKQFIRMSVPEFQVTTTAVEPTLK